MKDGIKILAHVIIAYTIAFSAAAMLGFEAEAIRCGIMAAVLAVCCYWLRRGIKKLFLFLGSHLLLLLGGIGLGLLGFWGALIIVLAAVFFSLVVRLTSQPEWLEEPGYLHLGMMALIFLAASYLIESPVAAKAGLWAFCLLLLLKVFYDNLAEMDTFIDNRSSSVRMDVRKMKRLNHGITLVYTGLLGLVLGLVALIRADGFGGRLWEGFKRFLRFLAGLFPVSKEQESAQMAMGDSSMQELLAELGEAQEPSAFAKLMEKVFQVLAGGLLAGAVIFVVIFIMVTIYRHFYRNGKAETEGEEAELLTEREALVRPKGRKMAEILERSPAKRIRRRYRKYMKPLRARSGKAFSCMSPKEQLRLLKGQSANLQEQGNEADSMEEVRELYEKARYGDMPVTEAEAERMKQLLS